MLAPRRSTLPGLRRDASVERAVQTRMVLAAERALEAQLARVITAAGRAAAQAFRDHGAEAAIATVAGSEAAMQRALRPSVAQVAHTFGARVIQGPKSAHAFETKSAFEDLDRAIRDHTFRHTSRRVVAIGSTTREAIRRIVREGLDENLGQEEIARRIVEATAGDIAMARARRIARTEVHNAAMFGQQAAAEASPLAFEKVWLATEDSRTRESHAKANGQRVALDAQFELVTEAGVVKLRYPGDTDGPAGEVINCRCVCLYEPIPLDRQPGEVETVDVPDRPLLVEIPEFDEEQTPPAADDPAPPAADDDAAAIAKEPA